MKAISLAFLLTSFCIGVVHAQEKGKISLLAYADYFYNIARDTVALSNSVLKGSEAHQAFQFRRIYFTYDYALDTNVATRFRLEADQSALTSDGKIGVFVKDAFVRWKKAFGENDLIFGIQPTPAFEVSEEFWSYRSLEKTIMDLRGVVGSRDFGIALKGSVADGEVGYWLLIGNGSGNQPEANKLKRYYGHVRFQPVSNVDLTVYADFNPRPDVPNPYTGFTVSNPTTTAAVYLGFRAIEMLKIGFEGLMQRTPNAYDNGTSLEDQSGVGISVFARLSISGNLEAVARFDHYDPNTAGSAVGDVRQYILGGLAITAAGNVRVIPNIQVETYESGPAGGKFESSVTGRITIAWSLP